MKKIIVTASTLLLLGGGITYVVNASPDTMPKVEEHNETYGGTIQSDTGDTYESYEEYGTLSEVVGAKESNMQLIKDNQNKRTMLLTDDNGEPQYKSIYMKKKDRLKVVDFDGGLIFNEVLDHTAKKADDKVVVKEKTEKRASVPAPKEEPKAAAPKAETKAPAPEAETKSLAPKEDPKAEAPKSESEGLAEYATLKDHVNVSDYTTNVVEDNSYKRIIVLKDNNNKPRYKSIYIKDSNRLKIINLRGGLVYNGIIN